MSNISRRQIIPFLFITSASLFFWAARTYWIGDPWNSEGFGALGNAVYAIAMVNVFLLISAGAGKKILGFFSKTNFTNLEIILFSLPLGIGVFSYFVLLMGLLGNLIPSYLIWLFIISGFLASKEISEIIIIIKVVFNATNKKFLSANLVEKITFTLIFGIISVTIFQSLTPPFNYDALMYHLQGPRLFLDAGKVLPIYDNWLTFYPYTGEMVYLFGMAFGSDIFSRLIHLTFLGLVLLATYVVGEKMISKNGGRIAILVLMGIPVLFLWGSQANNDFILILYQFLAVFLVLLWIKTDHSDLLILAGIMQGFAIGSKYLAFSGLAILATIILIKTSFQHNKIDIKKITFSNLFLFVLTSLLISSPWYIKNLIWTGNPIYPFFFAHPGVDPFQLNLWTEYMGSYGIGKGMVDFLLIPFHIFTQPGKFSTWFGLIDFPSPLFLAALPVPIIFWKNKSENNLFIVYLATITLLQYIVWAAGSQQTRFLFVIYPGLAILSAVFLSEALERINLAKVIIYGLLSLGLLWSLGITSGSNQVVKPANLLFGQETRADFLRRMVSDYRAMEFIQNKLPENGKVLLLWDGQGYYCDSRCVPDLFQTQWTALYNQNPDPNTIRSILESKGINYLMVNGLDTNFFINNHDPHNLHKLALDYLNYQFWPICTVPIYLDNNVTIRFLDPKLLKCN